MILRICTFGALMFLASKFSHTHFIAISCHIALMIQRNITFKQIKMRFNISPGGLETYANY